MTAPSVEMIDLQVLLFLNFWPLLVSRRRRPSASEALRAPHFPTNGKNFRLTPFLTAQCAPNASSRQATKCSLPPSTIVNQRRRGGPADCARGRFRLDSPSCTCQRAWSICRQRGVRAVPCAGSRPEKRSHDEDLLLRQDLFWWCPQQWLGRRHRCVEHATGPVATSAAAVALGHRASSICPESGQVGSESVRWCDVDGQRRPCARRQYTG